MYPYGLKEDLIVRLELNSSKKSIFCSGDAAATYSVSDISLAYDAIIDEHWSITRHCLKKTLPQTLTLSTFLFVHYKDYCFLINVKT